MPDAAPAPPSFADRTLAEVVRAIAGDGVAPGAGAASAVTLALAAACAAKAVAVTLRHRPEDEPLQRLREKLLALASGALSGAEEDTRRFEQFMRSRDARSAAPLLRSGERLQQLGAALKELSDQAASAIEPAVAGDLLAARALCDACLAIQHENLEENRRAARARQ